MIPLSPVPGRPVSLNLNLVPKEDSKSRQCSPRRVSPAHSRPPSTSPGATSEAHPETSHPQEQRKLMSSPVGPHEDCFSQIEKVQTPQQLMGKAQGQKLKGEQRKGKGGGKKDKKNSGNK